jgi:hypothetical protein
MRPFLSLNGLFRLWLCLFPTLAVLWYFPYIDFPIRMLTSAAGLGILVGGLYLVWGFPVALWALAACYAGVLLFLCLPAHRPPDREVLRNEYCHALTSYLGTRYVWGGEGYFGIDCSGFVRKAMEDALAKRGILAFDPAAVRQAISLYWHDTNARVIGEGYFGRTVFVTTCTNLNTLDYASLQPGDLAVTTGGDHIMAYLGDKTWIAADPGPGKVTEFHIPEERDPYFSTSMRIVRWKLLAD